jgi:signal transduction histidine kinase/DNA-binding LacI/PurR family transcriptional regulator/ActR/RegA family two-component response regulator
VRAVKDGGKPSIPYLPTLETAGLSPEHVSDPSLRRPRQGRLNIAVLLDHLNFFGRGYEGQLRDALHERSRASRHNLVLVYGGALDEPTLASADNRIFRMIQPSAFDGLIVASALLSAYSGPEGVARLVGQYAGAPLCSVGTAIAGVPSLVLDNRSGMEAAVEHLVRHHGCRRPVFLTGTPHNPEAEARFAAYRAVLERHGLPYDEARVACGQFLPALGRLAMDQVLARGVPFDAVVAANDSMAIGAIQALQERSLRVPQDVRVTGFDDLTLARLGNPPLTTVAQPFDRFADLAIGCIEDQVAGRAVAALTEIPARFIPRQSCGCGHREAPVVAGGERLARPVGARIEALRPTLADILKGGSGDGLEAATVLGNGLAAELAGDSEAFQKAVGRLLANVRDDGEQRRALLGAINVLRNDLTGEIDPTLERSFYEAFSLVAMTSTAEQVQHRLDLDESGAQASTAFDPASLRDSLIRALPAAGVRTALVSCVTESASPELEPLVCLIDGAAQDPQPPPFPAGMLVPASVLALDRQNTLLVFPLVHEDELLGVIAFDHQPGNNPYIVFRNQIAVVLRNIRLHQEVLRRTMLHERSVQERMATSKRLEALSVLAGGVAHDLNNALGPMLVIPDVIFSQLTRLVPDQAALAELRDDLDNIKIAAERAAQTIKDLLTLGRQGRRPKAELDLNRLVKSCLLNAPWMGDRGKLNLRIELASEPLPVRGAESQLARAVSNLLRNALEAVNTDGEVTVRTSRVDLETTNVGFETIPSGAYVVLAVADTGCGIPPANLERVFEPFFTDKQTGESSGTGLGLAIVHSVVKEHDGFIDVASRPGAGTTFTLYLPAGGQFRPRPPAPAGTPHARLLVIDDDETQLRTIRRILGQLGYDVETSASGLGACETFDEARASSDREAPFDLILVDMLLGEALDGLQVIEHIQGMFPKQKAIIISGHAPDDRADKAIKRGLTWLSKPYDLQALASAVAQTLSA